MKTDAAIAVVNQLLDGWRNSAHPTTMPLTDDYRFVGPLMRIEGAESYRNFLVANFKAGLAPPAPEVVSQHSDGEYVFTVAKCALGDLDEPGDLFMIHRVRDGLIAEEWWNYDAWTACDDLATWVERQKGVVEQFGGKGAPGS